MSEKVKGNSFRNKTAQTEVPKAPRSFALPRFDEFFANPKYVLAWGMFFIVLGIMLEMAFLSHIFTGRNDQSTLDILENQSIKEIGRTTTNVLGVFGAVVSQVFVYRWFGIAAILLPIIPITAGWALINKTLPFSLSRLTKQVIFFTIWVSALMGYVVLMSSTESTLSFLSGGFGYEINVILFAFLKWGSILVIALVLFLYIIFFYNVNSLDFLLPKQKEIEDEATDEELKEPEAPAVRMNVTRPTVSETVVEEESPTINQIIKEEITPSEAPIIPLIPNVEVIEEEVAELPEPIIEKEDTTTFEVDFGPEVKSIEKEPQEESEGISLEIENPIAIGGAPSGAPGLLSAEELGAQIVKEFGQYDPTLDLPNFIYPDGTLLREPNEHDNKEKVSQEELESNKNRIVETLANYGIKIAKIKAAIGPTVTLYEIIPEAGVRISKIQSLEKDIAMSLSALGIRIIAPMPGRGTIGIEVPNKHRETVFMRSVINSPSFTNCTYDLPVIMGKTISNDIYVADLAKMPHLLMAGATGQGKSVGLNVLLASLIYKKHPSQLKFVLVDPKKVELTLFNKLERHYLAKLPNTEEAIITDTKKVINTLNSLCIEMDTRYDLLKDAAVRNLKEYNGKFVQRQLNPEKGHRFLPFIVLVIDELADLMMTAGKEVETPIARLAQLARAVGIHLVLATQRPSVKVITGLIKANFPARLSFRVTSSIDSRTILDAGGAEQLVGQGDMLLSLNNEIIRLQCPFIDTKEVEGLCDFVGNQRGYDEAYALPEYEGDEAGETRDDIDIGDFDPLLPDGARLVIMHQQGSTSLIQRKMKLGYNRAGRIIDQLESIGIVGQFTGSKAREVLFHEMDALEEHLKSLGLS